MKLVLLFVLMVSSWHPTGGFSIQAGGVSLAKRNVAHSPKISVYRNAGIRDAERPRISSYLFPGSSLPYFREALVVNSAGAMLLAFTKQKSLTPAGLLHAYALGVGLWTFLDFRGWAVCVAYLILGSIVTTVKMVEKERLGIAEKRGGARGPENTWGSAAAGMMCALGTYLLPQHSKPFTVGYVAAMATKLADTFGSEVGKAYGKTAFLITTMQRVAPGTEGAVSAEGTAASVVGGLLLAALARALGVLCSTREVAVCVLASFFATTVESYIGAIFQDKVSWLSNEAVNLIMTIIGAGFAIGITLIM